MRVKIYYGKPKLNMSVIRTKELYNLNSRDYSSYCTLKHTHTTHTHTRTHTNTHIHTHTYTQRFHY